MQRKLLGYSDMKASPALPHQSIANLFALVLSFTHLLMVSNNEPSLGIYYYCSDNGDFRC